MGNRRAFCFVFFCTVFSTSWQISRQHLLSIRLPANTSFSFGPQEISSDGLTAHIILNYSSPDHSESTWPPRRAARAALARDTRDFHVADPDASELSSAGLVCPSGTCPAPRPGAAGMSPGSCPQGARLSGYIPSSLGCPC